MIRRRHTVSEDERGILNRTAQILKLKQEDLAELAGVSQAWLSITLSGKRTKREVENLARLARTLIDQLEQKRESLDLDAREGDELSKTLGRLASLPKSDSSTFVSPPGRSVPANAQNYVRRTVDDLIDECLESGNLSMYLVGPFQAGKTTLLLRLQDEARKKGFESAYFDCKLLAKPRFYSDSANVFRLRTQPGEEEEDEVKKEAEVFFRSLKKSLSAAWSLTPSTQLIDADFPTWAEKLIKFGHDRQALILLDNLGTLSPKLRYRITQDIRVVKNTNSFVSFACGLVEGCPITLEGKREERKAEASVIISSLSPVLASSFGSLSVAGSSSAITSLSPTYGGDGDSSGSDSSDILDWWFDEDQLKTLFSRLGVAISAKHFNDVRQRYGGQPFLSHLVAVYADAHKKDTDFKEHLKQLESQWSAFEQHKHLIRLTLIESTFILAFENEGLLERLPVTEFLQRLKPHYFSLLKIMGISNDAGQSPARPNLLIRFMASRKLIRIEEGGEIKTSCDWYKEIAKQLEADINADKITIKFED